MNIRRRLLAPIAAVTVLASCLMAPAAAASTPDPSSPGTMSKQEQSSPKAGTADATADATPELGTQYSSLTGALMSMYAKQSGQTLESYLSTNEVMVGAAGNATTGTKVGVLVDGATQDKTGATKLEASSVTDLDASLAQAGFGLDVRNYSSLKDMATDVVSKAHTADGKVTLAGAQWVSQLGGLRAAGLTTPTVGGATMPSIPSEALPFGLLLDQSIAGTVLNSPDLFAQAAATGVGSADLAKVFSGQLMSSWEKSNQSLTSVLPNVCTGAMLAVMASGDSSSAKEYGPCAPACTTGGLYLNNQVSRIFAPADKQLSVNETDQLWNFETLIQAQDWRTNDLLTQNPSLVQGLMADDGSNGGALLCGAASTSTTAVLKDTLSGVFGGLRKQ